jgi:hypothetical protein
MKAFGIFLIVIGFCISGFGIYQFTNPSKEEKDRISFNKIDRSFSALSDSIDSLASNRIKKTDTSKYDREDDEIYKLSVGREKKSYIFMGIGGVLFISGIICINNKK